ncbi:MAG: dephospho-CoA kinase [Limnothrix sp. RL_2_0]|nr:dephospho-CoA kinase [Limnothrix sp. RL_2_0]
MTQGKSIGLTGGIATGKSTVSDYLATRYQCRILDADIYAREAVAQGSPILQRIFQRYGDEVRDADGSLKRQALGNIVFRDETEKAWLESQIHPLVRQRFAEELSGDHPANPPVVCVIPLLIEANLVDLVDEIWVVTCKPDQQLQRLQTRNQLSFDQAQDRIQSQMPLREKIKVADVVLDNSSDLATLQQQVDQALKRSC